MSNTSIADQLQKELTRAQEEHLSAIGRFNDLMRRLPSGYPHPDASLIIQKAGDDSRSALRRYMRVLDRSTDFLVRSIVPEDLKRGEKRKPAASQQAVPDELKRTGSR